MNYQEKIKYENKELEDLCDDINSCVVLKNEFEEKNALLSWLDISAECACACAHKKNFYITGRSKKVK